MGGQMGTDALPSVSKLKPKQSMKKKAGRPIGSKNKPSHKAGRPSAGPTVNLGRVSVETGDLLRKYAAIEGWTIRETIEFSVMLLTR